MPFALRIAPAALAIAVLAACSGGSVATTPVTPAATAAPTATASASSGSTTLSVASGTTTSALPSISGATGSVALNVSSAPAGAAIAVNVASTAPAGVVALLSDKRKAQAVTHSPLIYISFTPAVTIPLVSFPAFTFTFPSNVLPAGSSVHEAFLDPTTSQPAYQLDIAIGANGGTLTATASALTLQAGKTYIFVLYYEVGTAASPTPSPSPGATATASATATPTPTASPTTAPVGGAFIATPPTVTKVSAGFPSQGTYYDGMMTLGSDGKLWIADQVTDAIRPLDPVTLTLGTGYVQYYPNTTNGLRPGQIVKGVDNRFWITTYDDTGNIYIVNLDGTRQVTPLNNNGDYIYTMAAGSDGRMYGLGAKSIRAFTANGALAATYVTSTTRTGSGCKALTLNIDGNLWYSCSGAIGKITPAGVSTEYPGHGGGFMAAGPDGSLWFKGSGLTIARLSMDGVTYKEYTLPNYDSQCNSIIQGPDQAMYLGCSSNLYKIVTTGPTTATISVVTTFSTNGASTGFAALTVGADGHTLWTLNDVPYAQRIQ